MEKHYSSFIKFGEKIYMEKLYCDGEIHCNTINHFSEEEYNNCRTDKYDGADYLIQAKDLKLKVKNKLIATGKAGQLYRRNLDLKGNIYCLYGIESETLQYTKTFKSINLNLDDINWGDTAVFIYDTQEFLRRMKIAIENEGYKYKVEPITYYDHKTYHGELSPFHKRKEFFENQKEIRYWIPNIDDKPKKIYIGDISDISFIIPKTEIVKVKYDYI